MKVIVDANIVFSGILNTQGKIGDLLINSRNYLTLIAPDFLRLEIRKNYSRLTSISGLNLEQVHEAEFQICKDISFISEEQIKQSTWKISEKLVTDIDPRMFIILHSQNTLGVKFGNAPEASGFD